MNSPYESYGLFSTNKISMITFIYYQPFYDGLLWLIIIGLLIQ